MATKTYEFTVEGAGAFPYDMLRYDCCYPKTTEDTIAMAAHYQNESYFTPRQVTLVTTRKDVNKEFVVTPDRWKSFWWKVVSGPELRK